MQAFSDAMPLWDFSQASTFSQIPDDDFLALLQKQFPTTNTSETYGVSLFQDGVNPQNISRYSLSSVTPPSEDSSPSPPANVNSDTHQSLDEEHNLKRKASDEDMNDDPKSQYAGIYQAFPLIFFIILNSAMIGSGDKKTKRKSSSGVPVR